MSSIYIFKYNNYNNRRLKRNDTLSGYGTALYTETGTSLNFNPNDGVSARFTAGKAGNPYKGGGDYLVFSRDNVNITSRWFIMDQTRRLEGQYTLTLQRDVIAEHWDGLYSAPMFIEKATLTDDNPLIFNRENLAVNQIKQSERLIKDKTQCAWLVGYLDRKYAKDADKTLEFEGTLIPDEILNVATINDWTLYKKYSNTYCKLFLTSDEGTRQWLEIPFARQYGDRSLYYEYEVSGPTTGSDNHYLKTWTTEIGRKSLTSTQLLCFEKSNLNDEAYLSTLRNYLSGLFPIQTFEDNVNSMVTDANTYSRADYTSILGYVGKIVKTNDGKTYKISVDTQNDYRVEYNYIQDALYNSLNTIMQNWGTVISGTLKYKLIRYVRAVKIIATEVSGGQYQATISSLRYHLKDAPYDMFIMPYGDNITWKNTGDFSVGVNKVEALGIAQGLAAELGTNLFDCQLLPFCPTEAFICSTDNGVTTIDINASMDKNVRRTLIYTKGTTNIRGAICWVTASSGSKVVEMSISGGNKKLENECDIYRLVSPNYNGQFEFNLARNGDIGFFTINYTYLPYQPFIRIAPNFGGLYGQEFKDARGLIMQGDFSISYMSDRWAEYQVQNKNYNNIFDREIENMDVLHRYQNINAIAGAVAGTLTGAVAGAQFGVAGAVVGGAASAAGGIADVMIQKRLQAEAIDYKTDLFNLQLDNVKALPNSITKVTAYSEINKLFPIIEHYTCTETEKKAVANKIAWNGMTVGAIGFIADYVGNSWSYGDITDKGYIKGKLIRFDEIDDAHELAVLQSELNMGVYTK